MAIAITMAEAAVAATITDQTEDLFQLFRNQEHADVKNLKK
ncbi:MAG: hypothetical protein ACI39N_05330 [Lachnospiraceae bacterium]